MSNKNRGFSLIELVIVITIMVVLTSLLAPSLLRYLSKSREAACLSNRDEFLRVYDLYRIAHEGDANLADYKAFSLSHGLDTAGKICPGGGACSFSINKDNVLIIACSVHGGGGITQLYRFLLGPDGIETKDMAVVEANAVENAEYFYSVVSSYFADLSAKPGFRLVSGSGIVNIDGTSSGEIRHTGADGKPVSVNITTDLRKMLHPDPAYIGDVRIVFEKNSEGFYTTLSHVYIKCGNNWIKYNSNGYEFGAGSKVPDGPPIVK